MRLRVGLTGGIGSGKSEVARVFATCGALVIDADALARDALAGGSAGLARVTARWPAVAPDGTLDRAALGAIVFGDAEALAFLNGIVHPFVRARAAELEAASTPERIVIHDVPLLFETGAERGFDATVLVLAPRESRIERVERRSGLSRRETEQRMAAQIDPGAARERATFAIDNDGTLERLATRARDVYARLGSLRPRGETSRLPSV